jgi:hypothetical protein
MSITNEKIIEKAKEVNRLHLKFTEEIKINAEGEIESITMQSEFFRIFINQSGNDIAYWINIFSNRIAAKTLFTEKFDSGNPNDAVRYALIKVAEILEKEIKTARLISEKHSEIACAFCGQIAELNIDRRCSDCYEISCAEQGDCFEEQKRIFPEDE